MLWFGLILGCDIAATDTDVVTWAGWVYADADTREEARLGEGAVTFWPDPFATDGEIAGEQPFPDYPGYWQVEVPPSTPVNVRITSPDTRPTVWSGDTPAANGNWFAGALFGASDGWLEDVFDALMGNGDEWVAVAGRGGVLVLGAPGDESLGCETFLVNGAAPTCWLIGEDGAALPVTEGPVTWFAADAAAGVVTVSIGDAEETWRADAGDVVMAWYLNGGR